MDYFLKKNCNLMLSFSFVTGKAKVIQNYNLTER